MIALAVLVGVLVLLGLCAAAGRVADSRDPEFSTVTGERITPPDG